MQGVRSSSRSYKRIINKLKIRIYDEETNNEETNDAGAGIALCLICPGTGKLQCVGIQSFQVG